MTHAISLRHLYKRFGTHEALRGIDLDLDGGEIVGIVGPDGAGKTSLIRALAGLLEVEAERAMVLGFDLLGNVTALKAQVGYVPQSFGLQRELSVIENLRFTGRLHRLSKEQFESRTQPLLARTGMAPFADRAAGALSGGMKQKLAVANALLVEPKLLLLDEPTAGVDVMARAEIWSMLRAARDRALVLITTSYLEEAEACDRLVYLDEGRVVATGTPEKLREAVSLELYRVWCTEPRRTAHAARLLPYVTGARQTGAFVRVEIPRGESPGFAAVRADLLRLPGASVHFVEPIPIDMESTLLHLARGAVA